MILAIGGTIEATETPDTWTCRVTPTDRTLPLGETHVVTCPCRGAATLHRASDRDEVAMLQYSLQHCAHQNIVEATQHAVSWWVPKDRRDQLMKDLERPGGNEQLPAHRQVEATRLYGDRTVELTWTRDVFRDANGEAQLQDTESIFVAVRPRTGADKEHVRVTTEPVLSPTPRCP